MNSPLPPRSEQPTAIAYEYSGNAVQILQELNASLFVTTYQANRILLFSPRGQRMSMLMRVFDKPTGLYVDRHRLILGTRRQIWVFEPAGRLRGADGATLECDICFTPRVSFVTGNPSIHELRLVGGNVTFVNTLFSCLSTPEQHRSFSLGWRPPFVSAYSPDDRCHLNGFAVHEDTVRYATALGETDEANGWRKNRATGGVLVDVMNQTVISRGMSMPHSPRLHNGALWVLNSGCGELAQVDPDTGTLTTVTRLPGFLRGLSFHQNYGFVGCSKIRESNTFGGLPIASLTSPLECGIFIVDLRSGQVTGTIRFQRGIEELFEVAILPGFTTPHLIGFEEETIDGLFVLPELRG